MCLELFNDEEEANNILKATDPFEMKRCGRKVRGFENDVWYKHCVGIVKKGVKAKVCPVLPLRCKTFIIMQKFGGLAYKMSLSVP